LLQPDAGAINHGPLAPELLLWAEVVKQALEDLGRAEHGREARRWLLDRKEEFGTFEWVCTQLGLDPEGVRKIAGLMGQPSTAEWRIKPCPATIV
jgi:hypothetical protein